MPPSMKCSPPISTGGSRPGTAAEARTASTSGPSANQCSPRARCSPRRTGTAPRDPRSADREHAASSARSAALACRCVRVRASVVDRRSTDPPNMSLRSISDHRRGQPLDARARRVGGDRRAVDRADRRPEHEVRDDPALEQRAQHPTSCAPSGPPPPPRTKATRGRVGRGMAEAVPREGGLQHPPRRPGLCKNHRDGDSQYDLFPRVRAEPRYEPTAKRVRAKLGEHIVADSTAALLVWEPRRVAPATPFRSTTSTPTFSRVPRRCPRAWPTSRCCIRAIRSPCTPPRAIRSTSSWAASSPPGRGVPVRPIPTSPATSCWSSGRSTLVRGGGADHGPPARPVSPRRHPLQLAARAHRARRLAAGRELATDPRLRDRPADALLHPARGRRRRLARPTSARSAPTRARPSYRALTVGGEERDDLVWGYGSRCARPRRSPAAWRSSTRRSTSSSTANFGRSRARPSRSRSSKKRNRSASSTRDPKGGGGGGGGVGGGGGREGGEWGREGREGTRGGRGEGEGGERGGEVGERGGGEEKGGERGGWMGRVRVGEGRGEEVLRGGGGFGGDGGKSRRSGEGRGGQRSGGG